MRKRTGRLGACAVSRNDMPHLMHRIQDRRAGAWWSGHERVPKEIRWDFLARHDGISSAVEGARAIRAKGGEKLLQIVCSPRRRDDDQRDSKGYAICRAAHRCSLAEILESFSSSTHCRLRESWQRGAMAHERSCGSLREARRKREVHAHNARPDSLSSGVDER